MAYLTLSENIVAVLITAANGVLSVRLGDAANQLEAWQHVRDCHFGTYRGDVGTSLRLLQFVDPELSDICRSPGEQIDRLTLSDTLPILLKYKHWYSNDEAAYWEEGLNP